MQTSYFARYKGTDGVSIAVGSPRWFKGDKYALLCPTWDIIESYFKTNDWKVYEERYRKEILSKLDPNKVYEDLKDKVILCWERSNCNCHRHIVAAWIKENTGHDVEEILLPFKS